MTYVVNKLSRYTHNPNAEHQNALKVQQTRIELCWLCCSFRGILSFCDTNQVTNNNAVKLMDVFTMCGVVISWKSTQQTYITRSTMKSQLWIQLDKTQLQIQLWNSRETYSMFLCRGLCVAQNNTYKVKMRHTSQTLLSN